jgi:hypothetical protein
MHWQVAKRARLQERGGTESVVYILESQYVNENKKEV